MLRCAQLLLLLVCSMSFLYGQEINTLDTISNDTYWPDLEKDIDVFFKEAMEGEEGIQGGVISIVSSDSMLLEKGYGLANVENNRLFEPAETNVFVASVSKLITVTAAFQLIEQGKINLDQPVKELIGNLKIRNPFEQDVLLHHILTHTAGFDDSSIGDDAESLEGVVSLKEYLGKHLPPVVWEPGRFFNYSNHGMALLAHIVENASGMSFNEYLEENLLNPLSMEDSSFKITEDRINKIMTRYKWKEDDNDNLYLDGSYGIKYTSQIGAGGFLTTANDMSKFMQMYLNKGVYNGNKILKPATISDMFTPHFLSHERMERKQGWIWRVISKNGLTYNYHSGDDTGIESLLLVIPTKDIAVFFASNNNEANTLKWKIRDYIIDTLNEGEEQTDPFPNQFRSQTNLNDLAGTYQYTNDGQSSIDRMTYLFGDVHKVTTNNGALFINDKKYTERDNLLFSRDADSLLTAFITDEKGRYYSTGYATYRQLEWYEKPSLHFAAMISSFIVLITAFLIWLIQYFRRKPQTDRKILNTKLIIGTAGFFLVLFFILLGATTQGITLRFGVPSVFWIYFTLPLIGLVIFSVGLFRIPSFFKSRSVNVSGKIHFGLVVMAIITCLLVYNYYNILGYQF